MLLRHTLLLVTLFSSLAWADSPVVGQRIPDLSIAEHGELLLKKNEPYFQPWDTAHLSDGTRMHVVMYIAPTLGASRLNKPFTDTLDQQGFDYHQVLPTSIINVSQAPWGAAGIVLRELTHNKRRYPGASLVADTLGAGLQNWQLKAGSYAVMILDPDGTVRFFKDGPMTPEDIQQALNILQQGVAGLPQTTTH